MTRTVRLACALLALTAPSFAQQSLTDVPAPGSIPQHEIQYLWPAGAPGAVGTEPLDKPHLELFLAPGPGPHAAVIVAPGGGYDHLAYEKEGSGVALWLNAHGVSAFVLTYRLTPRYVYPSPILDGYRSIRWVRANAAKYNVDPARIGFWGFSAGGHLTGMVATHFDAGKPNDADPIERVSDRPDFAISSYGLLTMDADINPPTALQKLMLKRESPELRDELSPIKNIKPNTPPFFLFQTTPDPSVNPFNATRFYTALHKAGIQVEMHIFADGPHGTGLGGPYPALTVYPELLANWMRLNGWMNDKVMKNPPPKPATPPVATPAK